MEHFILLLLARLPEVEGDHAPHFDNEIFKQRYMLQQKNINISFTTLSVIELKLYA